MDLVSGRLLWPAVDGLPHAYPRLHGDAHADVVVLGGGVTGALVAHALAADGDMDVLVLDKREIGWGSTAASTALLQYELDVPLVDLRRKIGRERADRSYLACRDAILRLDALIAAPGVDAGFARCSSLYLTARKRDVRAQREELDARREIGLDVEWIDGDDLLRNFGIRDRHGAICSATAAEVDGYALAHALLHDAAGRGVRVFARTHVERIAARDDGVTLHCSDGGRVTARQLVFASGYETRDFLRRAPAKLASTFAIASGPGEVPSPWKESNTIIWERARPYLYLRSTSDGRVIVGGEDEMFRDPDHRDALIPAKSKTLVARYEKLFGGATIDVAFAWAGTFGETKDGLPHIGRHRKWPSCHFALGYGGNGITFSVLAAEIIRDALRGRTNELAELFGFER